MRRITDKVCDNKRAPSQCGRIMLIIAMIVIITATLAGCRSDHSSTETPSQSSEHIHSYDDYVYVEATCSEAGYYKVFCSCGEYIEQKDEKLEPKGHQFRSVSDTESVLGEKYCSYCGIAEPASVKSIGELSYVTSIDDLFYLTQPTQPYLLKNVSMTDEFYDFSEQIEVWENSEWYLSTNGEEDGKIPSGVLPLSYGYTEAYIVVTEGTAINKHKVYVGRPHPLKYNLTGGIWNGQVPPESSLPGIMIYDHPFYGSRLITLAVNVPSPERDGYIFVGWTWDGQSTPTKEITGAALKGETEFVAQWEPMFEIVNNVLVSISYSAKDLTEIVVPEGVKHIAEGAFAGCGKLEKITLPDTVETIQTKAFSGCYSLKSIHLPANLRVIEDEVFLQCNSLESIYIPANLSFIAEDALAHIPLKNISCSEDNETFCIIGNCLINKKDGAVVRGVETSVIPSDPSITAISPFAFSESNIESVVIPKWITSIGKNAFDGCEMLKSVTFEAGSSCVMIGEGVFIFCRFTELVLPDSIEYIGRAAFCATPLKTIKIPEKLTAIESETFYGCSELESVIIPEGVMGIGESAFAQCIKLKTVLIPYTVDAIGFSAFSNCYSLEYFYATATTFYSGAGFLANIFEGSPYVTIYCDVSRDQVSWPNFDDSFPVVWNTPRPQ